MNKVPQATYFRLSQGTSPFRQQDRGDGSPEHHAPGLGASELPPVKQRKYRPPLQDGENDRWPVCHRDLVCSAPSSSHSAPGTGGFYKEGRNGEGRESGPPGAGGSHEGPMGTPDSNW